MTTLDLQAAGRSVAIAALNDLFRTTLGTAPVFAACPGQVMMTHYVAEELGTLARLQLINALRAFDKWEEGNDPYGERDFGAIELKGETFYFKIDYYNATLDAGAEDPADASTCARVLTLMHASEY